MGVPTPLTSPVVESFEDYVGRAIRITVTFDESTRAITGISAHRDSGCIFSRILIGRGQDGDPETTDKVVTVPVGDRTLTAQQLSQLATRGISTIEEFDALQITAGL